MELGSAPLDARDEDGEPALFYAAREGHSDVAVKLVEAGASVNVRNDCNVRLRYRCQFIASDSFLGVDYRSVPRTGQRKDALCTREGARRGQHRRERQCNGAGQLGQYLWQRELPAARVAV